MRNKFLKIFFLITIILLSTMYSFSQLRDYGYKFGFQFNGAVPATEFWESNGWKGSYVARVMLGRFALSEDFQTEIGWGYGSLAGLDFNKDYYRTEIIPIDLRFLFNVAKYETWNPFVYAGVGGLIYKVTNLPSSFSPKEVKKEGLTPVIPAGVGFEFALSDNITFELSGGINYSFTDNLNYFKAGEPTDAYYSAGFGFNFATSGKDVDKDNDGLFGKEEKEIGTDPKNPDTDGDGLKDGEEVMKYKTNPLNQDTDGDGLKDGEEVNVYNTNPTKVDTDDDGLSDNDELMKYKTDPLKADSDGDGLKDGEEIMKYKTNPSKSDTDDDGLKDGEEVNVYNTDPNKADSDGGTVNDGTEITNKTNPLDPNDDIPKKEVLKVEVGKAIVLEGIVFKTGSAEISPESEEILTKAFNTLKENPEIEVEIQGHTDNVGKRSMNMKLSLKRAEAVKDYLVNKGISASRITTKGFGPDQPIAPNTTDEGRQKNRRIEFLRTK